MSSGFKRICPTKLPRLVTQPTKGFQSIFPTKVSRTNNSTHSHKEHEHQPNDNDKRHNTITIQEMERLFKNTINLDNTPCQ